MAEHPAEDVLLDVALGHATAADREAVTAHLAHCVACRRDYDELASAVDLVLPAAPRVAPPPGFETRVLDRLAAARGAGGQPVAHGVRRRTVLWAAAAALTGAVAGAGATAYLGRGREPVPAWASPLLTADGTRVGVVARSYGTSGPALVVEVTDGPPGKVYTCRLRLADGSSEDVATWGLAEDGPNSWVVEVPPGSVVAAVELVGGSGNVWSSAEL